MIDSTSEEKQTNNENETQKFFYFLSNSSSRIAKSPIVGSEKENLIKKQNKKTKPLRYPKLLRFHSRYAILPI